LRIGKGTTTKIRNGKVTMKRETDIRDVALLELCDRLEGLEWIKGKRQIEPRLYRGGSI